MENHSLLVMIDLHKICLHQDRKSKEVKVKGQQLLQLWKNYKRELVHFNNKIVN